MKKNTEKNCVFTKFTQKHTKKQRNINVHVKKINFMFFEINVNNKAK